MTYPIETKLAPKDVWSTPEESRAYYGKYARDGVTVHWWGDGTQEDNHDNIVNFFLKRKDGSVNYVVSDAKITMMVDPDNVAWTSQSGNPTTISIEHEPGLSEEGYKRSGWLIWTLEQKYGKKLKLYKHSDWYPTECPGSIDLNRIAQNVEYWRKGGQEMLTTNQVRLGYVAVTGENPTKEQTKYWTGRPVDELLQGLCDSYGPFVNKAKLYDGLAETNRKLSTANVKLSTDINQLKLNSTLQIKNLQEQLTETVSKPVYVENPETGKKLDAIMKMLLSIKGMIANLFKRK